MSPFSPVSHLNASFITRLYMLQENFSPFFISGFKNKKVPPLFTKHFVYLFGNWLIELFFACLFIHGLYLFVCLLACLGVCCLFLGLYLLICLFDYFLNLFIHMYVHLYSFLWCFSICLCIFICFYVCLFDGLLLICW